MAALFTTILYLVNLITIFSLIFLQRKDMSVTFAWLMLLIFLPVIGFVIYFFFGSTRKLELMSKKYRMDAAEEEYESIINATIEDIMVKGQKFANPKTEEYRDMVLINAINSRCAFSENNNVELLVDGQGKFPPLFEDIRRAQSSINVMYFIYKTHDRIGQEMLELLVERAKAGVKVRLLYDALGCLKTKLRDFDELVAAGGEVQKFLPGTFRTLIEVNYRLHRKMVIIDGQICYTGGINVGDDYLGEYPHITPWRDTSVRLTGTAVLEMQMVFFKDWVFCAKQNRRYKNPMHLNDLREHTEKYFPKPLEVGDMGVQVIDCSPDSKYAVHKDSYVKICTSARRYLYIQSPYFVPDQTLLDSIRMAAQSGVDVRLMLPGIPDKTYVYNVAMSYVEELLEAGVRIYTHKGFLHAKTMVIDDYVASVGTTNLDIRSFKLDYEVNTLVYSEKFAVICKATFLRDLEDSTEINLEEFKKRGRSHRIKESLCRFIAPLS